LGGAGVLEVDGDRTGDVLDGQVAGDAQGVGVGGHDLGRAEGDRRVGLDVEEVGRLQVTVAVRAAGVDAGGLDGDLDGGALQVRAGGGLAADLVEGAADLGHHRVAGGEA